MRLPSILLVAIVLAGCGSADTLESPDVTTEPTPELTPAISPTPRPSTPPPSPDPATPIPAAGDVTLEIAVWDDTSTNPPAADAEIWVRGEGSWFPDLTFGGDSRDLGDYPLGEPGEFFIYPDGRSGVEIRVEFVMTEEMLPISGSTQAQTTVEIHDAEVVVIGMAIPGTEATYDR